MAKILNFHHSQAIVVDRTVYVSGCVGIDKDTNKLVEGGVVPETIQVLKNLVAVLEASGSSADKVVKATIFVEDMGDFALVNEEYRKGKCNACNLIEFSLLSLSMQ